MGEDDWLESAYEDRNGYPADPPDDDFYPYGDATYDCD